MKIGAARQMYNVQALGFQGKRKELVGLKKQLEGVSGKEKELEGVMVSLSDLDQREEKTRALLQEIEEYAQRQESFLKDKDQAEAQVEAMLEQGKCIEVARRIASGAKVPMEDHIKLMEVNPKLYMQAMNAAVLA